MPMTDKQQQRLENLEQAVVSLAQVIHGKLPPDEQEEVAKLARTLVMCCKELGSEAPNSPGELRSFPRHFKPELYVPNGRG